MQSTLAVLGMLIEELHRHSAAQRVADDSGPADAQLIEEVMQTGSEGARRIVGARLQAAARLRTHPSAPPHRRVAAPDQRR